MGMQKAEALARSWKEAFASVNAPFVFGFAAALAWMSTFYSTASADGGIAPVTGSATSDAYLASLAIIFVVDLAAALAPQTALHAIGLLGAWGPSAAMATGTLMLSWPDQAWPVSTCRHFRSEASCLRERHPRSSCSAGR